MKFSALLLLLIMQILFAIGQNLDNNEHCEWGSPNREPCDQTRGLTCNYDRKCSCWNLRTIFSRSQARCVGKAGEECVLGAEERICTDNSYCLEDPSLSILPICMCNKGYFKTLNGSCQAKSKHGEFCTDFPEKQVCAVEEGLKCINYTCQCGFLQDQRYDPLKGKCISLAGGKCSKSLNSCIENADCNDKLWGFDYETGDTKLIGYRCKCKSGLKITEDGNCAADYKGDCSKTSDCYKGEDLICLDGKCQCNPLSQVYDTEIKQCVNLAGTKCENSGKCTQNAECSQITNTCKCIKGSSETPHRTCLLNYGQPCTPYKCNIFDALACFNETCRCYDSRLVYDETLSVCASTEGQPCGKVKSAIVGYEGIIDELFLNCEANCSCVQSTSLNGNVKQVCLSGVNYRNNKLWA